MTINTKLTIKDIVGDINLPGLKDVELDEIQISKTKWTLFAKIKGNHSILVLFKHNGSSKHFASIQIGKISPAEIIPDAHKTPLKDVEFDGLSFLYNPTKTKVAANDPKLPGEVRNWLIKGGAGATIKPGMNVFGHMNVHPSGEMAKLLKGVGIKDLSLPLSGGFSTKVLEKNISSAAIKNEILDNLDLKIPLPKMNLPGVSKVANIRSTQLAIKGINKGGKRSIIVDVSGELDIKVGSKNIDFDFDVEMKGSAASRYVEIYAYEKPGKTIKIDFLSGFTLDNIFFEMDNSQGHWVSTINASAKLGSKNIKVAYINNPKYGRYMNVFGKVTLADAIDNPGLPGLDDVEFDTLEIGPNGLTAGMKVKGIALQLAVFKQSGSDKHFISWAPTAKAGKPSSISPATFIPGAAKTPLKDVSFQDMAFVFSPRSGPVKLDRAKLTNSVIRPMEAARVNLTVKPGLNVFGHMSVHPSGEMAKLLKGVGVTHLSLPMNGGFSTKAFAKNPSAVKNALLDALDLDINLPPLNVPEVGKFLTFKDGKLKIKGKTPGGKRGIDVAVSGEADVHVKHDLVAFNIDVEYDTSSGNSDLKFTGSSVKKWTHPLGIKFLDLEALNISIDKKKKAAGDRTFDIKMTAKSDVGRHSKLDVKVDIHEKNGKVTDAFFELDGPLKLSDIPGVKDIPHSEHFTIDTIKASEHGVEAKTDFGGNKDLDVFLFDSAGWNLILRQDNFALTEIVPPLKNTPLKHVVLSEAAIVLSKDGLSGPLKGFSVIAQDALKDIFGANATNIDVGSGLSLIAAFEHKKAKGGMSEAFSRMGLSQERVILTGDIGGLFGGPMKLEVDVDLSAHTGAKNQPKWMKSKPGVEAVFSMIATETAGQFDVEFGIGVDIIADVHGTKLVFDAKTALEFEDEKIDVKIVADLKDKKGWHKPFGIPGFTLYEVGFDLGIAEDGAIHLGFDGNIKVSGDKFTVKADADLLPEALGAPQDIAFVGSADQVDMFFVEEVAIAIMGGDLNMDIPKGILPTFTKVKFAFVTPGAQDPDLHITGEGFALAGGMSWLDHELGSMGVSVGPKSGISASGKIDNLNLGPLHLKNNDFAMKIGVKSIPSLKVDSDIELLGIKERFKVAFGKTGITLDAALKFGPDFSLTSDLTLSGINISAKKPSFTNADFAMDGDFKLDIGKFVAGPAKKALDDVFNGLDSAFKAGEAKVKSARTKVNGLTTKINAERAKVRKEKAKAEARVQSAENRVNSLQDTINDEWKSYHHCHGWGKWPCRIKYGIEIGGTKVAKGIADEALRLAKSLISHFPIDLDPRVAALIAARDVAKTALNLALDVIEGADALDGFMKKAVDKLTNDLKNSINIHKASFKGDLRGIIEHDTPVDLSINAEFFGATINDTFAFQIGHIAEDLPKDVEHVALLGLYALHNLVEKGISDIPGPLKNKLKGAIASKFDGAQAKNKRELAKYSLAFNKYNKAAELIQADYAAYNLAFLKAHLSNTANPLDSDTSENISDDLIEVGHTGLCLTTIGGLVKQHTCTNGDDRKWSTRPASGAAGVKAGLGYMFIYQPKGGHCIGPEGSWSTVAKKFGDFTFPVREFQGDGKISVRGCVNTKEFYWKLLKHGDGWMQIANLATNKCLHFTNSNALPGEAEAEWESCIGSANQVFRAASSVTPVYHADNIVLRNDQLGLCVGSANPKDSTHAVPMTTCAAAARFDYMVDIRGDVKFINRASGKCLQPGGYKMGAKMIEVTCTQLDYQWWEASNQPGGIIIKNAQTQHCTQPPFSLADVPPTQVNCASRHNAVFAPVKQKDSGPSWKLVNARSLPAKSGRFDAGGGLNLCSFNFKGSFVPGVVNAQTGQCSIFYGGAFHAASDDYRLATSGSGMEWLQSDGKLHWSYIPTGGFGGAIPQTIYTCKAKPSISPFGGGGGFLGSRMPKITIPSVGWTVDGKTCFLADPLRSSVTKFKVLARTPASYFELKMGGSGTGASFSGAVPANLAVTSNQPSETLHVADYLIRYVDLQRAFIKNGNVNYTAAKTHWNDNGKLEGRNPRVFTGCNAIHGIPELQHATFDPCFYVAKYGDLKRAFGNDHKKALTHWEKQGVSEGRQSAVNFSIKAYVNRYADLKKAFTVHIPGVPRLEGFRMVTPPGKTGINYAAAYNHWFEHGQKEGRNPSPLSQTANKPKPVAVIKRKPKAFTNVNLVNGRRFCIDESTGKMTKGVNLIVWTCNGVGSAPSQKRQLWTHQSSGQITVSNGLCMDLNSPSATPGMKLILWACNGGSGPSHQRQRWRTLADGRIQHIQSGYCIDSTDNGKRGGEVQLQTCKANSPSQTFSD